MAYFNLRGYGIGLDLETRGLGIKAINQVALPDMGAEGTLDMANNEVTPANVCQNVAVLRSEFKGFSEKQDDLIFKVDRVLDEFPETRRKANKHHETYADDQVKIAKIDPICEEIIELKKNNPANDKGEERREGTFKRMPWWQKLSIIVGMVALLFRPEIQDIVQSIVKAYLGIE